MRRGKEAARAKRAKAREFHQANKQRARIRKIYDVLALQIAPYCFDQPVGISDIIENFFISLKDVSMKLLVRMLNDAHKHDAPRPLNTWNIGRTTLKQPWENYYRSNKFPGDPQYPLTKAEFISRLEGIITERTLLK